MNIGSITSGAASAIEDIASIAGIGSASSTSSTKAAASQGDSSSVSGAAGMLSKLKQLQQKDPAAFKKAMSDISSKLKDAASAATDPKEQKALSDLSAKFQTAGETGDLSGLTPSAHAKHGHGHHGGPPPAAATNAADTNGDGTVSQAEQDAADGKTPSVSAGAKAYQSSASSDARAHMQETMTKVSGIVSSVLSSISG